MSAWKYFPLLNQQGKCDDKGNLSLGLQIGNAKGRGGNYGPGKGGPSCPVGIALRGGRSSDGGHVGVSRFWSVSLITSLG